MGLLLDPVACSSVSEGMVVGSTNMPSLTLGHATPTLEQMVSWSGPSIDYQPNGSAANERVRECPFMTSRGFGFLVVMIACVAGGALVHRDAPIWLGAAGMLWFALEAAVFTFNLRFSAPGLTVERFVGGRPVRLRSATVGRDYQCQTVVSLPKGWGSLPKVEIADRVPTRAFAQDSGGYAGSLAAGSSVEWTTTVTPLALG